MDIAIEMEDRVRAYIKAYNDFDTEAMVKDFAEDMEFINEHKGEITMMTSGLSEFKGQIAHAKNYFQFREISIEDLQIGQNTVTISTNLKAGMIKEKSPGQPAKIQEVEMKGSSIFHFQDGKIVKLRDIY